MSAARTGSAMNGVETAYAAAWRVVRALPAPVARAAFTVAADLTVRRNTKGVARLRENLRRVADVEDGRGAIVALPHAGNWDIAGAWAAAKGWPLVAIAERLRPEGLYRRF